MLALRKDFRCLAMPQAPPTAKLYDRDFAAWCDETVAHLQARQFHALDLANLIEEIEGLGRSERRQIRNRLDVLLNHLLKRLYVASPGNYRGWELTIREQRKQLRRLLADSPSLQAEPLASFDQIWQDALADLQYAYPDRQFPDAWPFSREIGPLLSEEFWNHAS